VAHREFHPESDEHCADPPWNATEVDRLVLAGIDELLADADTLRGQLGAGRRAERARLEGEVEKAQQLRTKAQRASAKAMDRYTAALREDDDDAAEINLAAAKLARKESEAAEATLNAALDALAAPEEVDDGDVLVRVWAALSGRMKEAQGDVTAMNLALRETFSQFQLYHENGRMRVVPVLSPATLAAAIREPERFPSFGVRALDETVYVVDGPRTR
jgi:hypothetical protein